VEINGDIVSGDDIATATQNEGVKEDVAGEKKKLVKERLTRKAGSWSQTMKMDLKAKYQGT
jgi:hypothetical protein